MPTNNVCQLWAAIDTNIALRNQVCALPGEGTTISEDQELQRELEAVSVFYPLSVRSTSHVDQVLRFDQVDVELLSCITRGQQPFTDVYRGEVTIKGYRVAVFVEQFKNSKTVSDFDRH